MTTIKVKFRPSTVEGQPGSIFYAITRHRIVRTITSSYKIYPCEWDDRHSVLKPHALRDRKDICAAISRKIKWDIILIERIVSRMDEDGLYYTAENVVQEFQCQKRQQSFFRFMQGVIMRLKQLGHEGTSHNYLSTMNSFSAFRDNNDLDFHEITPLLIEEYQAWLTKRSIKPNTISFYMRNLRATYNRAVAQGLVIDTKPFAKSFTGNEKTIKRGVSINEIKRIKDLDLSMTPELEFARDIFLFLFYCRGMSFIDAAYLRMKNIIGYEIIYRRHKTNQELSVGINKHIRELIKRYHKEDSPFLLPILTEEGNSQRLQYESSLRSVNNSLKKVGQLAGISIPLTTYVSRHSWASIAKTKGIPTSTISDALGHDSEQTTQIYLASISNDTINQANEKILNDL